MNLDTATKTKDFTAFDKRRNNVRWFVNRTLTIGVYETAKGACAAAGVSVRAIHASQRINSESQMRAIEEAFETLGYSKDIDYCIAPTQVVLASVRVRVRRKAAV